MRPKLCLVREVNRMLAAAVVPQPAPEQVDGLVRGAFEDMVFRGARAEADLARGHSHEDDMGEDG